MLTMKKHIASTTETPSAPETDPVVTPASEPVVAHNHYDGDPMTPSPTLLRRIATSLTSGNPDALVNEWAESFGKTYPE